MAIGTAGYTAMLAVMALERHGLTPSSGPALVTGAAGGVGSTAISLLAAKGWKVIASTGRTSEADYLRRLGAVRDHRARLARDARQAARQGTMGGRRRQRRLEHARQCAGPDPLRRRGRRLRSRRRHGPAGDSRSVHPARRHFDRHRQRQLSDAATGSRPGAAWRAISTARSLGDDADDPVRRGVRRWPEDSEGRDARAAGGGDRVSCKAGGFRIGAARSGRRGR